MYADFDTYMEFLKSRPTRRQPKSSIEASEKVYIVPRQNPTLASSPIPGSSAHKSSNAVTEKIYTAPKQNPTLANSGGNRDMTNKPTPEQAEAIKINLT
jgi:hypothetical protein